MNEYTNKYVSGPSCSYSKLISYGANYQPGVTYVSAAPGSRVDTNGNTIPNDARFVKDSNGNTVYNAMGNVILALSNGALMTNPVTSHEICGCYNTVGLAYRALA